MPFIRVPSKALIDALGWDAVQEIESYFEDAAEELRAERRRLEAVRRDIERPAGSVWDVLSRLTDLEYQLRIEISEARHRVQQTLGELRSEIRSLRAELRQRGT